MIVPETRRIVKRMKKTCIVTVILTAVVLLISPFRGITEQNGKPVYGNPAAGKRTAVTGSHDGSGTIGFITLLEGNVFDTNVLAMSYATIPPGCSIGEHIHRHMEEMFIILDGSAQHTVNGHTAELPVGSMVLCGKGSSHGVYNHTDKPITWLYFAVSEEKGKGDAVNYGDDLTKKAVESPAPFLWTKLDRSLLKPASNAHGGKGDILFRRCWNKESFATNWEFVDHCILPPGTSIGYHQHNMIEEVYFLVSGSGRMTVNDVTWDVKAGDAIPCTLHDSHGLYNNGTNEIELIVFSCAVEKGKRNTNNWGDDLSDR